MEKRNRKYSMQTRLIGIMVLMQMVILVMNLFINNQINTMVKQIDSVFESNVTMDDLSGILEKVEENVYEYLNTKSSHALENYYLYSQDFQDLIMGVNDMNVDNEALMLEKNIRSMSESYLVKAEYTVQAKRGRNVEKYREYYDEEVKLYRYIKYYIYRLNSLYFATNSASYENLLAVMGVLRRFSYVTMIMVFLFGLVIVTQFIRTMFRPLRNLSDAAMEVAAGNLDVQVPDVESRDEIGIVADAFQKMLVSIRELIAHTKESVEKEAKLKEQELAMEAHLREAQLRYLQAQINPHFLFNSLNAGAQLAMLEDAENTGVFLEKMADFFRYNVKKNSGDSTLAEEIEAVDNYIYILNVRFAGDITYVKRIPENIGDIRMPGLILRPLVENAVSHGIHDQLDDGVITLTVDEEDGMIRITVADNGVGMTKEMIAAIMEERLPEEQDKTSTGIGLTNVMNRLELYYDRAGLFSIHSDGTGFGTEVTILLPKTGPEHDGEEINVSDTDRG